MMKNKRTSKKYHRSGAALILVVVVTVLLAVIGVMFLMTSRLSEMETAAVADSRDLEAGVQAVVERINDVLAVNYDEPTDYSQPWLCALEPNDVGGGNYEWLWITDLYELGLGPVTADIVLPSSPVILGEVADADGDGVSDSRWVQIPALTSSKGKPIYAAVRMIDNCAMLNLNTAHCFYQTTYADNVSFFEKPWYENDLDVNPYHDNQSAGSGRYLSEINYLPFLRGRDLNGNFFEVTSSAGDNWYNIDNAKGLLAAGIPYSPVQVHDVLMNFEYPGDAYHLFDISDELEIRNRFLLTSQTEARFEQYDIANYTLDAGGGVYAALQVPRDTTNDFNIWKRRINPINFDAWSSASPGDEYIYDRRHVCTFYSFDRPIRLGQYPLLKAELTGAGLTAAQVENILWPLGAVTTNIEVADSVQPYNNTESRRRILHLLFALREYYYDGINYNEAATKAAQVVANIIDYSDDDAQNTPGDSEGPFYETLYGAQANADCTFITEEIIQNMIDEVSFGVLPPGSISFGLTGTVFGYERQPYIAEIYTEWSEGANSLSDVDDTLDAVAIEMVNPYDTTIDMEGWKIVFGSGIGAREFTFDGNSQWDVPAINSGRAVYHGSGVVPIAGGVISTDAIVFNNPANTLENLIRTLYYNIGSSTIEIKLQRPAPPNSGVSFLTVDVVSDAEIRSILNQSPDGAYSLQRDDDNWKYVSGIFELPFQPAVGYQMGHGNTVINASIGAFQLAVPNNQSPMTRWHELETLSLYGYSMDPNEAFTAIFTDTNKEPYFYDLNGISGDLLDYLCTINRPDKGTLPGRININTAPMHVIAAAIPPTLVDPNTVTADPVTYSSLDLARDIVKGRPYEKLSDLLTNVPRLKQYDNGGIWAGENVGQQSIDNDIEEEHWIFSNLANKFTVRSDVFTAYVLVRLGTDGPQRRMIAIFDRSNVWDEDDRPGLVALHPVPDPR